MNEEASSGNVLVVTDDRETGERIGRWIASVGERAVVLSGAEKFLVEGGDDGTVDLVIADLDTAESSGLALLRRLVSGDLLQGVPRIYLFRDADLRESMVSRDPSLAFVSMPSPPDDREFRARVRLAAEVGRLRRRLTRTSIRDPLTGLYNRAFVVHRLEEEFARARRYRSMIALVFFDIDQLREVNEKHGERTGDMVIRLIGEVLQSRVRKEDIVGRTGEESFGVVLPNNRFRGAAVFANNIRTEFAERLRERAGPGLDVRISAGVSCYPCHEGVDSPDQLLRATEDALVEAKRRGGNRVFIDEAVLKGERRLVLVVDPDRRLLELTEDLLSLDDYRVVLSDSPHTALETLRFRRPDLLVLDLQLASEGELLVDRILRMYPGDRFPIVGLSRDSASDPEQMARLGVDRFITKPFSLSVLRSVVRELLDSFNPVPS